MTPAGRVDCFIEYNGVQSPLWIQPRCTLSRLKTVLGLGLALDVAAITLKPNPEDERRKTTELVGDDLLLIEALGVKTNDIIVVTGTPNGRESKFDQHMLPIQFNFEASNQKGCFQETKVSSTCTMQKLRDMAIQNGLFKLEGLTLWHNGKQLNEMNATVKEVGIKANDVILAKGTSSVETIVLTDL